MTHPPRPRTSTAAPAPAVPARMRAVVQDTYGGPETWRLAEVAVPAPEPGQVLVAVHAAGVDRGTWHLATGLPYLTRVLGFGLTRPKQPVPGLDVSGRVVAVGADVTRFEPGDAVFGIASGAYAEYAVADAAKLATLPDGLDHVAAAAAPVSGITALQALTDAGRLRPGQRVLVIGASGGVGSYVVQLAAALGAEVTGVASARKAGLVASLGAENVLAYDRDDYLAGDERYDLVVDINGRNPLRRLRRALTAHGTLVIVGGEGGGRWTGGFGRQLRALALSPFVRQRLTALISSESTESLDRLAAHLAAGEIVPAVGAVHPLERAHEALAELTRGKVHGKAVVLVRPNTPDQA